MYKVVISGKILEGFEREEVQRALAGLFRTSEERVGQLLAGKSASLRKAYAEEEARRLCDRLTAIGVACTLRDVSGDGDSQPAPSAGEKSEPTGHVKVSVEEVQGEAKAAANFTAKPLPVKVAIVSVLLLCISYMTTVGFEFLLGTAIFLTFFMVIVWALIRAYRLGWVFGLLVGVAWSSELGIALAAQEGGSWRLLNVALEVVILFALLMPESLRLLRIGFVSRLVDRIPDIARPVLPLIVMLLLIPAVQSGKQQEVDLNLSQSISTTLIAVEQQEVNFRSALWEQAPAGSKFGAWPVGRELKLEPLEDGFGNVRFEPGRYVKSATYREGGVIEVKFIDAILHGASIEMYFDADGGGLTRCHTDTIPGKYIHPTCINCACNPSSSVIQDE